MDRRNRLERGSDVEFLKREKMKNNIWIMILAVVMLCGCEEYGDVDNVEVLKSLKSETPNEQYLNVDVETLNLNASSSTQQMQISSNIAWSVECSESWIKPNANNGSGNMIVLITISENPSENERTGTITIRATNGITKTVLVRQAGKEKTQRDPSKDDNLPPN